MPVRLQSITAFGTALLAVSFFAFALALYLTGKGALSGVQGFLIASSLFLIALASLVEGVMLQRRARLSCLIEWLGDAQKNALPLPRPLSHRGDDEVSRVAAEVERILERGRASAARYFGLIDIMPAAAVEVDAESRVVFSNREAEGLLGYGKEELLGKPFPELLGEESRPLFRKLFETIANGSPVTGFELPVRTKAGRTNRTELSAAPLREGGKVTGAVLVLRDADEVSKIRDELSELKRRAEESSGKLRDNIRELEEFALMAVKRELKMKEIRESLRKIMEEEVRH